VRLNVGCGEFHLDGWCNMDEDPACEPDWTVRVPPIPLGRSTVDEIWAGHFLEHLERYEANAFLAECYRVLVPGGRVGVMVPDTLEVMRRYVFGEEAPMEFPNGVHHDLRDLDEACATLLFSTLQRSQHRWAYDRMTLDRALARAGFVDRREVDRFEDPRVSTGQWYQIGLEALKPS